MFDEGRGEGRFWGTVAFAIVMVIGLGFVEPTPKPAGETAPVDVFSAARARSVLTNILQHEQPHPTGTAENDRVRQRVIDAFGAIGLDTTAEDSLVCSQYGSCALVRNVIAEIPGRREGPAVLLNAHYDSVAAGPGAGDDGAGVATLLEVARAIRSGPTPERTIRFLVDDAEEAGLLGAEAWRRKHANDETLATIVLEARGSSGPALMFETHSGNLEIVRAYARAASDPATSSVFFSIYERLPNRTNFTVFKRAGYRGLAIAFIEDPARYHTPQDDLAHLSDRSLQHMGDLALSLAREISDNGLAESRENASYFDLLGGTVVFWPEPWNMWMAVTALVLLSVVGVIAWKKERARPTEVIAGWVVMILAILMTALISLGAGRLAAAIRTGTSDWTANGSLLVIGTWLLAAACVTIPFTLVKRPPLLISIWISVWLLQALFGVVLARLLPGAAYLFFIPVMVAGMSGLAALLRKRPDRNAVMILMPFGVSLLLVLPILNGLYDGLGLALLPGIAAVAALLLTSLLVVSTEGRRTAMFSVSCFVGAAVCVAAFFMTPVYSSETPRAINVASIHDADLAQDRVVLLGSADPLPPGFSEQADWTRQPVPELSRGLDGDPPRLWTTSVEFESNVVPNVSGSSVVLENGERELRLEVRPRASTSVMRVRFPANTRLGRLVYGDEGFALDQVSTNRLILRGAPDSGAVLTAVVEPGAVVEVIEERPDLPPPAQAFAALRSESEVPIGPGDRALYVTRLKVDELDDSTTEQIDAGTGS